MTIETHRGTEPSAGVREHENTVQPAQVAAKARAWHPADWLLAPLLLCAIAGAVSLVFHGPDALFGIALAGFATLGVAWLLVCVFSSARADRTCPGCGRDELRRLDPHSTRGVVCRMCGRLDREQSSFLMAEEEGPIEPIVMQERRRKRQ
jgi:hypothetical protein